MKQQKIVVDPVVYSNMAVLLQGLGDLKQALELIKIALKGKSFSISVSHKF